MGICHYFLTFCRLTEKCKKQVIWDRTSVKIRRGNLSQFLPQAAETSRRLVGSSRQSQAAAALVMSLVWVYKATPGPCASVLSTEIMKERLAGGRAAGGGGDSGAICVTPSELTRPAHTVTFPPFVSPSLLLPLLLSTRANRKRDACQTTGVLMPPQLLFFKYLCVFHLHLENFQCVNLETVSHTNKQAYIGETCPSEPVQTGSVGLG